MTKAWWMLAVLALVVVAGCSGTGAAGGDRDDGTVAISVTEGGFEPAEVTVEAGKPVTLVVTRRTEKTCATEIVMPAMSINQKLPLDQAVEVTFTPTQACTLDYACGMDMIKGRVIVK
jgi:plastocyanin domain-containing protein